MNHSEHLSTYLSFNRTTLIVIVIRYRESNSKFQFIDDEVQALSALADEISVR